MPSFTIDFDDGISSYNTADEAEAAVVAMGLKHAERPMDDKGQPADLPSMPDLSECGPQELIYWMGIFTEWFGYANGRLTYFSKVLEEATEKRNFAWSYLRKHTDGTVSDKDDTVRTDPRYVQVNREYRYAEDIVKDLRCIVDNQERNVKTLSRAIAVMEQRLGVEGFSVAAESKLQRRRDALTHFVKKGRER